MNEDKTIKHIVVGDYNGIIISDWFAVFCMRPKRREMQNPCNGFHFCIYIYICPLIMMRRALKTIASALFLWKFINRMHEWKREAQFGGRPPVSAKRNKARTAFIIIILLFNWNHRSKVAAHAQKTVQQQLLLVHRGKSITTFQDLFFLLSFIWPCTCQNHYEKKATSAIIRVTDWETERDNDCE